MTDERIKRPRPERIQPFRSWSTLVGGRATPPPESDGEAASATAADGATTADGKRGAPDAPSFNDVVARAVDIGYRVIDEYIRQGQRAAQRFSDRSFGPDVMMSEARDVTDRAAQHASDVLGLWFQFLEVVSSNGTMWPPSADVRATAPPATAASASAARPSGEARAPLDTTRVAVEVMSPHPTEVALDLRPDARPGTWIVHSLRAADPDKPRLTEVSVHPGAGDAPVRLRIRVPAEQPAGTYSGLIVEEGTSKPVGTVTVRIARE